jgi:hypothetical protein
VELDEDGWRTVELEDRELREGAVVTRPLKEADEEEVEENLRINLLAALLFSVEVEDLFVVLVRDGVWEREEEKRFTMLLVFVFDVFPDLMLFVEDEGNFLVTTERLGVVRFTLWEEDLNLEGTTPFPCVTELLDVTDFCEFGVNLLMARDEIPALLRLELDVRTELDFTRERELIVFPEE